jgi:hypothetical protein
MSPLLYYLAAVLHFATIKIYPSLFSGVVVRGQKTLNDIYRGYEDMPPHGNGPDQKRVS